MAPGDHKTIEWLQESIVQLTGALNAQIEQTKTLGNRIQQLEGSIPPPNGGEVAQHQVEQLRILNDRIQQLEDRTSQPQAHRDELSVPRNEQDLNEIRKLPDCVRDLQIFEGNPTQYISWVHSVESILKDYEIVKQKPIYRSILQHIRQKVRGAADSALISYNIFDDSWPNIKKCLSLHYADKRDLRTLEHELNLMRQGNHSMDEFYARVNHQLSLIINKIKTEDYTEETVNALVKNYRNRALDIFIRGLKGDVSRMLLIQRPQTLPEAYSSCLEIQNYNFRNFSLHPSSFKNVISAPINQMHSPQFKPRPAPRQITTQDQNQIYNYRRTNQTPFEIQKPPPRPDQPKPPIPMEIDSSIRSHRINYMNRPIPKVRHSNESSNLPRKQQRLFNLEIAGEEEEEEEEGGTEEEYLEQFEEGNTWNPEEVNFTTEASLAYHT